MYRSGVPGIYARRDFSKLSAQKQGEFRSFSENIQIGHPGKEISRETGKIVVDEHEASEF